MKPFLQRGPPARLLLIQGITQEDTLPFWEAGIIVKLIKIAQQSKAIQAEERAVELALTESGRVRGALDG